MKTGKAEIVCTGSELLAGRLNLYVPLFHQRLAGLGFAIAREQSCGDSLAAIADCLAGALSRARLVIACGGLGPTFDDLTRQAAAKALGRRLVHSPVCAQILKHNYGLTELPPNFKDQCLLVEGAKQLENTNGTACGQVITEGGKMLVLLPGPRREWEPMFPNFLDREINEFFGNPVPITQVKLRTAGLKEPEAEKLVKPAMRRFAAPVYTILAGPGTVDFIISGDDTRGQVARAAAACRSILGRHIYGEGELTLAGAVGEKLKRAGRTVAGAESCTGGLVSQLLTENAGSSDYFGGCAVTYSNAAKSALLGVRRATLNKHGAVSAECAAEMAAGARKAFGSDYAYSVTGIAGPGGGTADKPLGLVYFAIAAPKRTFHFQNNFRGDRANIRLCAASFVLNALRQILG
jgi:nicotinamide-nucleotide amidase